MDEFQHFLLYLYEHGYDSHSDDDVKDAIVNLTCEKVHWTDEELDHAVVVFRSALHNVRQM